MKLFHVLVSLTIIFEPGISLYSSSKNVIDLTTKTFDDLVVKTDEIWIVKFYVPWCIYCQNLVSEYIQAADALRGVVKVGAVDANIHKELSVRYGIRGLPTIKIFAVNKMETEDYKEARNAQHLIATGIKTIKDVILNRFSFIQSEPDSVSTEVVELTDHNFDEVVLKSNDVWMVQFHEHSCGHCKALEPHWKAAANKLKGKVKFAKLDGSVNKMTATEYGVTAYPDIRLFLPGELTPIEFNAGRTSEDILEWINEKLKQEESSSEEPLQILDESSLKKACQKKNMCLLAFLPSIVDCPTSCKHNYISILKTASYRFKTYNWGWVWSVIDDQPDLQEVLNVDGSECPILIAVDYYESVYAVHRGQFSEDGILKFLRNLADGNELLNYISKGGDFNLNRKYFPKIYTISPWDRKQEQNVYDKVEL